MSELKDLLEEVEQEAGLLKETSQVYCTIDPVTRTITVPEEVQLLGVENDKRVERLYFRCPKIVGDNQDLSQNYHLFINYSNAQNEPDAYHIEDMEVDGEDIVFSWRLEENVTKYQGTIQIAFGAIIPGDEEGNPDKNRWNTTINKDCTCLIGLKSTQVVAESNPDALVQIWQAIDELKAGGGGSGTPGKDGREIEIQNNGTAIQWRYVGDDEWTDLVQLSDLKGEGVPEGGTTGQVLVKKSDADYDAKWVTISSSTENNYELVGTTPFQIDDGSWFVKPEVETVISNSESFSDGVIKNIAEDASPYELSEFITSLEVEQNKNKIKLISYKANSDIQPFYYIWFPTETGKTYTFFVTTDSGRKSQYIWGDIFPAENVSDLSQIATNKYIHVDSGKGFTFKSSKNYAGFSYSPWYDTSEHTNTYYLFEGEYQSIPEGGNNITLTVQPGEKKVLSAFSGTILYANPETKVYKNVDGVNESPKETIICFGDSIMQLCKIPEYINEKYETDMYNLGVSGATVSYRGESSDGNNAYDFVNIVDSLGNNDLSIQIEKGQNQNFESLLGLMSKANILIVEYGTNDFQGMKELVGEENTTIEGAYRYCLNKLSELYPYKKIIVLSTLGYTLAGANNGSYDINQLKEKVKEICNDLHFPFIDMMTLSNITDSNKTVFLEDGVHPKSENGRKRYADALYYALKTIIGV